MSITVDLLRGRFTALILWNLFWGRKGFYQILREVEGISPSSLARELEELERIGVVERRARRLGGPRVEYSLSPLGETLRPVVGAMYQWGLMAMNLPVAKAVAAAKPRWVPQEEHSRPELPQPGFPRRPQPRTTYQTRSSAHMRKTFVCAFQPASRWRAACSAAKDIRARS